jgi:hypothetical protein
MHCTHPRIELDHLPRASSRPGFDAQLTHMINITVTTEFAILPGGRACLVGSEIYGLPRTGHAAGAQARWRTLHELAVVASTLATGI